MDSPPPLPNDAQTTPQRPRRGFGALTCLALGCLGAALCFFGLVFLVAIGSFTGDPGIELGSESVLRVRLADLQRDGPLQGGMFIDPADAPITATEMARAIRRAGEDGRIEALYLVLDGVGAGWAVCREVREALLDFQGSGKPSVAAGAFLGMRDYYVASACDKIALAPGGVALVNGCQASVTYFKRAFDKIGVDPEFEHVGDYKSAVEPYERSSPSAPAAEAYESMLDSLWNTARSEIAASRKMSEADFQALVDRPSLSPADALQRGLIDAVAFPDAVETELANARADDWNERLARVREFSDTPPEERFVDLDDYADRGESRGGDTIAIVHADGPIVDQDGGGGLFGDTSLSPQRFQRWMRAVRQDDSIRAVVLRVNSPGGSGLASDLIWRELELVQATGRPVVVSMGDYAASGGYYISCGADWIVAQPSTLTGSIGVFGGKLNLSGTFQKLGLDEHRFKRGAEADLLDSTAPFSDGGRIAFRDFLEDFYATFLARVSEGRKLELGRLGEVAKGRVWTGAQAVERGLVDELGGLDEALAKAAELSSLESYGLVRFPPSQSFFDLLVEAMEEEWTQAPEIGLSSIDARIAPDLRAALGEVLLLEHLLARGGVAAYLPGSPRAD